MTTADIIAAAHAAVRLYAETHPRPSSVSQEQAAEMLGCSHPTVRKMLRAGQFSLNALGRIPTYQIDRALAEREEKRHGH